MSAETGFLLALTVMTVGSIGIAGLFRHYVATTPPQG